MPSNAHCTQSCRPTGRLFLARPCQATFFSLDPATGAEALPPIAPLLNVGLPPQPGAQALPPIGPLLNVGLPPQPGALAHGPSSLSNPHAQACGPGLDTGAAATHQHALICPGLGSQRSRTIGLCPSTANRCVHQRMPTRLHQPTTQDRGLHLPTSSSKRSFTR
jgi:hypothetical protein